MSRSSRGLGLWCGAVLCAGSVVGWSATALAERPGEEEGFSCDAQEKLEGSFLQAGRKETVVLHHCTNATARPEEENGDEPCVDEEHRIFLTVLDARGKVLQEVEADRWDNASCNPWGNKEHSLGELFLLKPEGRDAVVVSHRLPQEFGDDDVTHQLYGAEGKEPQLAELWSTSGGELQVCGDRLRHVTRSDALTYTRKNGVFEVVKVLECPPGVAKLTGGFTSRTERETVELELRDVVDATPPQEGPEEPPPTMRRAGAVVLRNAQGRIVARYDLEDWEEGGSSSTIPQLVGALQSDGPDLIVLRVSVRSGPDWLTTLYVLGRDPDSADLEVRWSEEAPEICAEPQPGKLLVEISDLAPDACQPEVRTREVLRVRDGLVEMEGGPPAGAAKAATPRPPTPPPLVAVPGQLVDLLHSVPAVVAVSSVVDNTSDRPEHLVDGDLGTAWNSRTGDLAGAWVAVRLPPEVQVKELRMTAGFTRTGPKGDLFTTNQRVRRVKVTRGATLLGELVLDPELRTLQTLPLNCAGGELKIELVELQVGSKKGWREACVSELQLWGTLPPGTPLKKLQPVVRVGSLGAPGPAESCPVIPGPPGGTPAEILLNNPAAERLAFEGPYPQLERHCATFLKRAGKKAGVSCTLQGEAANLGAPFSEVGALLARDGQGQHPGITVRTPLGWFLLPDATRLEVPFAGCLPGKTDRVLLITLAGEPGQATAGRSAEVSGCPGYCMIDGQGRPTCAVVRCAP